MSVLAAMLANKLTTSSELVLHDAVPKSAPLPAVTPSVAPAVRRINLHALTQFVRHIQSVHPDLPELSELKTAAQLAIGRFPVPVLGPGLARTVASMPDPENGLRNVFGILMDAESRLRHGGCINTADAIVRAFAAHHRWSLSETRQRLMQASRDCEFFSPEVVLMLAALTY